MACSCKSRVLYLRHMNEDGLGISEGSKTEQALRESDERFRLAAKAGRMFAYSWDAATDVIERSGESAKILGIDEAALLTGHQAIARVHPDDREGLLAAMARLSPEKPFLQVTYRIVRPDDSVIWVERHSQACFGEHGKIKRIVGMIVDITEKKQAQAVALRHAAIVASSDDAIIGVDINGTVTDWNKGAERVFGYSVTEAMGRNISFLSPADRSEDGLNILKKVINGEAVKQYETVRRRKDGTPIDVSITLSPIVDAEGKIIGASGIGRDMTDRKLAERELFQTNERLNLSMEAGRIGCWEANIKEGTSYWFGQTHALLGTKPEILSASTRVFWGRVHPEDRGGLRDAIQIAIENHNELAAEFRVVWWDGSVHWLRSQGRFYYGPDGQAERMLGISVDITERKEAEEALRKSEERLRMAQWAAHIGTFDLNLRTGVDVWMPETEALYGLPPGGFGGTLTAFENLVHPDDRKRVIELTREMMRTGEPTEAEWRVVWPDGSVRWIASRGQVFIDESGEPSRMLGVNLDITERKRTEQALSAMPGRLIQSQEQERTRIARELHDDISQRLALVAMNLDRQSQNLQASVTEMRLVMGEATKQVSDLVSDLHEMSHRLHSSKLDTVGLVAAAGSFCRELAERQNVKVDFHSEGVPKKLPEDVSLSLFRVLQEALQNAAKHSGAKHYRVSLRGSTNQIALTVSDKGRGFDLTETLKGDGLGITSMMERMKQVGGQLLIDVGPSDGTTINASVPFHCQSKSASAGI